MRVAALLFLAACGRIGFGVLGDGARGDDGNNRDGRPGDGVSADAFVSACPAGSTAPDPLTLTGGVFDIGTFSPVPNIMLAVSTSINGTTIASATSNGVGNYTLHVPTGGVPIVPFVTVTGATVVKLVGESNRAYDQNTTNGVTAATQGDIDAYYAAAGITQDINAGTLVVAVVDCSANPIANVTGSTTPATTIVYTGPTGTPDNALTATSSASLFAALNVPVGAVQIHATAAGMTFTTDVAEVLQAPTVSSTAITPAP